MRYQFQVGQRVVMVRPFGPISELRAQVDGVILPVRGPIYTIRGFDDQTGLDGALAIWLNEIHNPPHHSNGIEPSFFIGLFEPVVDRPTDISIFKAMLTPAGKVKADA